MIWRHTAKAVHEQEAKRIANAARFTSGQFGESHTARSSEADSSCISQLSSGMRGESQTLRKCEAFRSGLDRKSKKNRDELCWEQQKFAHFMEEKNE